MTIRFQTKMGITQQKEDKMKTAVLDIGGSFIKYGQIDEDLTITERGKVPTPEDEKEAFLETMDSVWEKIGKDVDGLAVSMPGVIDSANGYAISGGALKYLNECHVAEELEKRYRVPVWIGNDAKCAAVAEVGYGALKGIDTALVIILGTGIGGCLILNGEMYMGKHFSAGEASFIHTDYHKPYDRDEWWAYVNGKKGLLSLVQKHKETEEEFSGEEIFAMAEAGDEAVQKALDEFCRSIAVQLFNINCMVDVEKIAIGGGISAQPMLIRKINEQFSELYSDFPYPLYQPPVVACRFLNDANMIGAYYQFGRQKK